MDIIKGVFIMVVVFLLVFFNNKEEDGKPAPSLKALVTGGKCEVMTVYERYIIIKSATDNGLRFIGPLDFGTITTGRYIKTAEENLEKIE